MPRIGFSARKGSVVEVPPGPNLAPYGFTTVKLKDAPEFVLAVTA